MAQILMTSDNYILFVGNRIVYGRYEDEDKWIVYDDKEAVRVCAYDNKYKVVDYTGELPEDVEMPTKYFYEDGSIIQNPDWTAPPLTEEERIDALEQTLADQDALLADILLSM